MPELPEVETTKRGLAPFLAHKIISEIQVHQPMLRVPVTPDINTHCQHKKIINITRRGKYLLIELSLGTLLIHLGMSGHLRTLSTTTKAQKHDHIDLIFTDGSCLRYHDPRRFGLWLYVNECPEQHKLLSHLGLEPLSLAFNGAYLFERAHKKKQSIKPFIMNHQIVVGVGNIYATESLFHTKIHPLTPAKNISQDQMHSLSTQIKATLEQAILAGGTTLRDFYSQDGKPGYFATKLNVYGRYGLPCLVCSTPVDTIKIAGRYSAFCPQCQLI